MRNQLKRLGLLVALIFLAPGPAPAAPAACTCGPRQMEIDPAAGLCLPRTVEGLDFFVYPPSQIAIFQAYRNTMAVGFRQPASGIFLTLYLYDRIAPGAEALAREFQTATDEILNFPGSSRVLKTSTRLLTLGGQETEVQDRLFLISNDNGNLVSFLWLAPAGDRYLKVRTSFPYRRENPEELIGNAVDVSKRAVEAICAAR